MKEFTQILIILILIVLPLIWYVRINSSSFNNWYGDNSFLKVERQFSFDFFIFLDILIIVLLVEAVFIFILSLKLLFLSKELNSGIFCLFTTMVLGFIPFFEFKAWHTFYKLNGNYIYTFNPINKSLSIDYFEPISFIKDDILKIEHYNLPGRLTFDFKIIFLKSGEEIVITDRLPFFDRFNEFFGDDFPEETFSFSILEAFKYLKWLKNFELYS